VYVWDCHSCREKNSRVGPNTFKLCRKKIELVSSRNQVNSFRGDKPVSKWSAAVRVAWTEKCPKREKPTNVIHWKIPLWNDWERRLAATSLKSGDRAALIDRIMSHLERQGPSDYVVLILFSMSFARIQFRHNTWIILLCYHVYVKLNFNNLVI